MRPQHLFTTLLPVALAAAGTVGCGPGDDDGAACSGLVAGDLVISEVLADFGAPSGSSGADEGHEWFEIYNARSTPVELEGLIISHGRPDMPATKSHVMRPLTLGAGDYLVLGDVLPDVLPAHVDYGYAADLGDLYNSNGGRLTLTCGDVAIDEAVYDNIKPGQARVLDGDAPPDYLANDDQNEWCDADEVGEYEYEPANYGTPGAANQDCVVVIAGQCDDGGTPRATDPPQVGDLVITEVMPSPSAVSDTVGEWFEVRVNRDLDINDLALDRAGDSSNPIVLSSATCRRVTAGTYLVFARSSDTAMNGMLPRVDGTFSFSLVGGSMASPGDVRILIDQTELDAMSWTSSRSGASIQLDMGLTSPGDNDVAGNLCDGNAAYGAGDLGTPGGENRDCGTTTTGMCMDTTTMNLRPIVKPMMGQVHISEWMPDPTLVGDSAGEWFEVRATAAVDLNGLQAGTTTLGATPIVAEGGPCLHLEPGGDEWALFARNAVAGSNGMLPPVDGTFSFNLVQSTGSFQIGIDNTNLDTATWATSMPGKSIMLDSDGTQCDAPAGVMAYNGTDVGTPGAINTPPECP